MNFLAVLFFITSVVLNSSQSHHILNQLSFNNTSQDKKVLSAADTVGIGQDFGDDEDGLYRPDPKLAQLTSAQDEAVDSTIQAAAPQAAIAGGSSRPNIIVLMVDDMPPLDGRWWNYLPNIKNIVDQSAKFTNYYGEDPLCCPGRASFLTGQHTLNHGVYQNDGRLFNPSMTIATQLQKAGYYTFAAGKYVNAFDLVKDKTPPGWNHTYIYGGGFYNYTMYNDGISVRKGTTARDYSGHVILNKALDGLRQAPANRPIFAYIAPYAIHGDDDPGHKDFVPAVDPIYKNDPRCSNIPRWTDPGYAEKDLSDKPNYVKNHKTNPQTGGYDLTTFCRALLSDDAIIGKVKAELSAQGRLNNTIFIVMADNGMNFGEHGLESDKKTPYSVGLPLYISWPSKIGTTPAPIDQSVQNIDMAPTLCDIAGCSMGPYPNGQKNPDGKSFLPLLLGQPYIQKDALLENYRSPGNYIPRWFGVQTTSSNSAGLWQYVEYETGEKELYDISNGPCYLWTPAKSGDPCKLNNLVAAGASQTSWTKTVVNYLHSRLNELRREKGYKLSSIKSPVHPTPTVTPSPTPVASASPTLSPTPTFIPGATLTPTPIGGAGPNSLSKTSSVTLKTLTSSFITTADAFVRSDIPDSNFGGNTQLRADGSPSFISFLKFDLSKLQGKTVSKAILKLRVSSENDAGSALGQGLGVQFVTDNSWSQNTITFNNKPLSSSTVTTITGARKAGDTIEIDLTSLIGQKAGQKISLSLSNTGPDGLVLNSREAAGGKPTLTISYK